MNNKIRSFAAYISSVLIFLSSNSAFASIEYISSVHNGNQLTNENGMARVGIWKPENKLEFSGYGPVKLNGLCLTARAKGFATWQPCIEKEKVKSQTWSLKDKALINEAGYCAEVENFTHSVLQPRVKTRTCADTPVQRWQSHEAK